MATRAFGVVTMFDPVTHHLYDCVLRDDPASQADTKARLRVYTGLTGNLVSADVSGDLDAGRTATFALSRRGIGLACTVDALPTLSATNVELSMGVVGLEAAAVEIAFDYVVAYVPAD
ncbi:MAG: hypothetical protein R2939_06755 [Kofleriaceae bacterium]